jgi:hypothetical protein
MTVQINARVPDELASALDRVAAKRGTDRAGLLREVLAEVVDADREGRTMFERPEVPGPQDLNRLVTKLEELTTEQDRVLRQNAKRDAELLKKAREDTLGVSEARSAIASDVVGQVRPSLEAVHGELAKQREDLTRAISSQPQFKALQATLDRIAAAAEQPKTVNTYTIGPLDWRTRWYVAAGLAAFVLSLAIFYIVATVLPQTWLAVPTANRLLGGGDQAICALVNYQFDKGNCVVTKDSAGFRVNRYGPQVPAESRR